VRLQYAAKLVLVTGFVVPLLAGCITSEKPLSQKKDTDDRLLGTWVSRPPKGEKPTKVTFGADADGWYKLAMFDTKADGSEKVDNYRAYPTLTRKNRYLNVDINTTEGKPPSYMFFKYTINKDKMAVYSLDRKKVNAAINAKKLKGVAGAKAFDDPVIQEDDLLTTLEKSSYFDKPMMFTKLAQ
jgi:hypothetical protein